ncbi:DNA-(apurinic or apyrimidinic site) endonuclease isoform X2 [Lagopus muta]|uniref:DNA-(apurinic or apyrimidinic site) endonuclease isoform X2 n=1 Tax=Lagopus muta TaxID=64668 RepID=UPI0020A08F91|nr:DNA-(apurinic or apyrimidinic site) endonuclease isoform X2 [Lagopus muta]
MPASLPACRSSFHSLLLPIGVFAPLPVRASLTSGVLPTLADILSFGARVPGCASISGPALRHFRFLCSSRRLFVVFSGASGFRFTLPGGFGFVTSHPVLSLRHFRSSTAFPALGLTRKAGGMPKRSKKGEDGDGAAPKSRREDSALYEDPPVREETAEGRPYNLKVTSWNVDGIRAWVKKGGLKWIEAEAPDVLCLQETKCGAEGLPAELNQLQLLPHKFWGSAVGRPGYSGVGLLSRTEPLRVTHGIGIDEHDAEGRVLTAEFPSFYIVSAYVPNSGRGLNRLPYRQRWDRAFRDFLLALDTQKPVVLCGDLNVAHQEIDLKNPKSNRRSAGFTQEERDGFGALLDAGFLDSFRVLYPTVPHAYTFWTYMGAARERNVGWRLDYFLLSGRLRGALCDSKIRSAAMGSDHCPITLYLALEA